MCLTELLRVSELATHPVSPLVLPFITPVNVKRKELQSEVVATRTETGRSDLSDLSAIVCGNQ
jgi:hypothetical protein